MSSKSFYDLDFIIEMNERRISEYHAAFLKVWDQFTVLIIIYSAIGIFLVPLVEQVFAEHSFLSAYGVSFILFSLSFLASFYYAVRLIIPANLPCLRPPYIYYVDFRLKYESSTRSNQENREFRIKELLKKSYITELEGAMNLILNAFLNKRFYYYRALVFALLSILPYAFCLGMHIFGRQEILKK